LNQLHVSERRQDMPVYRRTSLVGASTPTQQRIVALWVNVPAPHLLSKGHVVAEWDPDVEELEKKQQLYRFVMLVFKQRGAVSPRKVAEHSMDSKEGRVASLSKFIRTHPEIIQSGTQPGTH